MDHLFGRGGGVHSELGTRIRVYSSLFLRRYLYLIKFMDERVPIITRVHDDRYIYYKKEGEEGETANNYTDPPSLETDSSNEYSLSSNEYLISIILSNNGDTYYGISTNNEFKQR